MLVHTTPREIYECDTHLWIYWFSTDFLLWWNYLGLWMEMSILNINQIFTLQCPRSKQPPEMPEHQRVSTRLPLTLCPLLSDARVALNPLDLRCSCERTPSIKQPILCGSDSTKCVKSVFFFLSLSLFIRRERNCERGSFYTTVWERTLPSLWGRKALSRSQDSQLNRAAPHRDIKQRAA